MKKLTYEDEFSIVTIEHKETEMFEELTQEEREEMEKKRKISMMKIYQISQGCLSQATLKWTNALRDFIMLIILGLFNEAEIKETFDTLDMNKNGFVT